MEYVQSRERDFLQFGGLVYYDLDDHIIGVAALTHEKGPYMIQFQPPRQIHDVSLVSRVMRILHADVLLTCIYFILFSS